MSYQVHKGSAPQRAGGRCVCHAHRAVHVLYMDTHVSAHLYACGEFSSISARRYSDIHQHELSSSYCARHSAW